MFFQSVTSRFWCAWPSNLGSKNQFLGTAKTCFGNFQNSLDIQPEITEQVSYDMSKFNHNRWVSNKINEGWRWGSHYSSKNKTHPALKDWDTLPESHRRKPEYDTTDIMEWLKKRKII